MLVVPRLLEWRGDLSSKMKYFGWYNVRDLSGLLLPPHMFGPAEFRGVWPEPLDFELSTVPLPLRSHRLAGSTEPVDDEGDGRANFTQEPGAEEVAVLGREIVVVDVEQKPHAATLRKDAEGRDDCEPVPPVVALEDGRLALRGPCLANLRLEYEAQFVLKNSCLTSANRVFFSVATPVIASIEPLARLARGPAAPASAASSLSATAHARFQTDCRSH